MAAVAGAAADAEQKQAPVPLAQRDELGGQSLDLGMVEATCDLGDVRKVGL
jgi:hypothetical protein